MEMKLRTGICLGFILLLLGACSSNTASSKNEFLLEQFNLIFNKKEIGEQVNPRNIITRSMIDKSNIPLILIEILNRDQTATMSAFPGSTLNDVWLGTDGSTVTTKDGLLFATRGMSHDLMGANAGAARSGLENTLRGQKLPDHQRRYKYLSEDNKDNIIEFSCFFSKEGQETILIFEKPYETTHVTEICENDKFRFQNEYWVEKTNIIRKSRQWHGYNIGLILIERLI